MSALGARSRARAWGDMSLAEQLAMRPPAERDGVLAELAAVGRMTDLNFDWRFWARPKQLAPAGDWRTWMLRAGRGFGKTRAGTGWVQEEAYDAPGWFALVARTPADARDFMVEGPGGFLDKLGRNVAPDRRPLFEPSKRRLTWPNGAWATIFSDEEPEQLRGFSGSRAWLDEFGKFNNPEATWDNLQFGMREISVPSPRQLITTTPRPLEVIKRIEALPDTVVVRGSSYENRANLDPAWFEKTLAAYEGTSYGRQEIYGDLLDPEESGVVKRSWFSLWPQRRPLPVFDFVLVSLDTAFTERTRDRETRDPDQTAGGVYGLFSQDRQRAPGDRATTEQQLQVMVLDCWDGYLGFPDLVERAKKEMKVAYGAADAPLIRPLVGPGVARGEGRRPDLLVIEDKGSGISLRQQLAREDVPAYAYNPGKVDKLARLHLVSHVVKAGLVWLVESESAPGQPKRWYEPLLSQLCSFAGEGSIRHDDHVDQFTQALRVMLDKHLVRVTRREDFDDPHAERSPWGKPVIVNPYAA